MINPVCRLLSVATFVFVVMLAGCSIDKEDGPIEWDEERTIGKIIGFIDDSLVIVSDWRGWNQEKGTFIHDGGMASGIGHQGLRVYNYRVQEDGPHWTDTLDNENMNDFTYLVGQVSDSVIWGGNGNGSFSFWKLGQKPTIMNMAVSKDGCNATFKQERMRTWLNGEILLKGPFGAGGDSCQYAILDTVERTITYKRLDDELKWIEKCNDVRAWGTDVYCIAVNEDKDGFRLIVNSNQKDSILVNNVVNVSDLWLYFEFEFTGNMIYFGRNVNSIDYENKKIVIYPNVKASSALNFVDENENSVNYDF